jgi:2-polyprenyl-6-methoxyphenol hydroxylase-like FAD-dependent oxidoreductase
MAGICSALALAAAGCEVHVYEERPDGFSPSSEVGVPLTEELQSFCKQHGVELVSVCSWQLLSTGPTACACPAC